MSVGQKPRLRVTAHEAQVLLAQRAADAIARWDLCEGASCTEGRALSVLSGRKPKEAFGAVCVCGELFRNELALRGHLNHHSRARRGLPHAPGLGQPNVGLCVAVGLRALLGAQP